MRATTLRTALLASAVLASAPAFAVEPPRCDDARVLADVTRAYASAAQSGQLPALVRLRPREVSLVAHVDALDTPRNRLMLHGYAWGPSRFCEARLELAGQRRDTAYWRLEVRDGAPEDGYELTPCFEAWVKKLSVGEDKNDRLDCSVARP